jgi:hypothetical protein
VVKMIYTIDAVESVKNSNMSDEDKQETLERMERFVSSSPYKIFIKENLEYLKRELESTKPNEEKFSVVVVDELPTKDIKEDTIYILQDSYIYRNGEWIPVESDNVKSLDKCIEECKDLSILKYLNELKELRETK